MSGSGNKVSVELKRLYGERSFIACYPDLAYMEAGNIFEIDCFLVCEASVGSERMIVPLFVELTSETSEPFDKFGKQAQVRSTSAIVWLKDKKSPPESMLACLRLEGALDPLLTVLRCDDTSALRYSGVVGAFSQVASLAGDVYVHLNFYVTTYTPCLQAGIVDMFEDFGSKLCLSEVPLLEELEFLEGLLGCHGVLREMARCASEVYSLKLNCMCALVGIGNLQGKPKSMDEALSKIKKHQPHLRDCIDRALSSFCERKVGLVLPQKIEGMERIRNFVQVVTVLCNLVGIKAKYVLKDEVAATVVKAFVREGFRELNSDDRLFEELDRELQSEYGVRLENVDLYLIIRDYNKDKIVSIVSVFCEGAGPKPKSLYIMHVPEMFVCVEGEALVLRNKLSKDADLLTSGFFDKVQLLRIR